MLVTPDPAQFQTISGAPGAEAPRLVLADWLEERGSAWGELITVQCALARLSPRANERAALMRREQELLARRDWWPYGNTGFHADAFSRGFPWRVRVDGVATLRKPLPWVVGVDDIAIPVGEGDLAELASLGPLPTRGVTLEIEPRYSLDAEGARAFLAWEGSRSLRRFGLRGQSHRRAVVPIFDALEELEELELDDLQHRISSHQFESPRLRRLSICRIGFDGFLPELGRQLEEVALTRMRLERRAADLVRMLPNVQRLDLTETSLDEDGAYAVVKALPLSLRALSLASNHIGASTIERIAELELDELDLFDTQLTPESVKLLLESSTLPATLVLTVSHDVEHLSALRDRFAVVLIR